MNLFQRFDLDKSVEMGWNMVIEKHLDDNPIKSGNLRHRPPFDSDLEKDLRAFFL